MLETEVGVEEDCKGTLALAMGYKYEVCRRAGTNLAGKRNTDAAMKRQYSNVE